MESSRNVGKCSVGGVAAIRLKRNVANEVRYSSTVRR
jgi:hypothetical protein